MNLMEGKLEKHNGWVYFNEGNFMVKLQDKMYSKPGVYERKEVTFGIRPENIRNSSMAMLSSSGTQITAKVEVIELIGNKSIIYLTIGKTPFIARLDSHVPIQENQMKSLILNVDKAQIFDKQTEQTIV